MVRIGLIGFGFIGKGLYHAITDREFRGLEVAFVWNRSADKLAGVPAQLVLADIANFADAAPVTCALATVGIDRCRGRMIADPALDHAVAEVEAWGKDGSHLMTVKQQPMVRVSGTEMLASARRSLQKATGAGPTMDFL